VRDMLRRRMLVVRQATQTLLSLQSMVVRHTGQSVSARKLQDWTLSELRATFVDPYSQQTAAAMLELLGEQRRIQHRLEKQVLAVVKQHGPFVRLLSLPGIGNILGLTITLETGPIQRFGSAGQYASYCRTVDSRCVSNGKTKGQNNRKNGNEYLAWAYVEAANFAQRYSPRAQAWFARKQARRVGWWRSRRWPASWPKRLLSAARRRGLRRGQDVWSQQRRRPPACERGWLVTIGLIGSGRRRSFTECEDGLFCPQREPERVGRPDPIGTSQRTVRLTEWTRCGTEGFLGPHRGQGPRRFGRKPEARSQARWVTEQNSDTKQPRRRQSTRIAVGGSTEEEATKAGKASAGTFVLIGTFNG